MTDEPSTKAKLQPELRADLLKWCGTWQSCFQSVLTQVAGSASEQAAVFEISYERPPLVSSDLWYTVTAAGAARGEMTLRLPASSAQRLALRFLGETETQAPPAAEVATPPAATLESAAPLPVEPGAEPVSPEPVSPEHKEAVEELLRQISGLAATGVGAAAGGEVKFVLAAASPPSWSSDSIVSLRTRDEAGNSIAIEIQISPALAAALLPEVKVEKPLSAPAPPQSPASPPSSAPPPPVSSNYDRLMGIGLDVKLRFGVRHMLLRDVLAMNTGVVVELENPLHSPVDLLLDGRIIARGEVVVVDGKYGLRVTAVINPQPSEVAAGSP
jgi:flagellar motor switch protein FliN